MVSIFCQFATMLCWFTLTELHPIKPVASLLYHHFT